MTREWQCFLDAPHPVLFSFMSLAARHSVWKASLFVGPLKVCHMLVYLRVRERIACEALRKYVQLPVCMYVCVCGWVGGPPPVRVHVAFPCFLTFHSLLWLFSFPLLHNAQQPPPDCYAAVEPTQLACSCVSALSFSSLSFLSISLSPPPHPPLLSQRQGQ